MAKRGRKKSIRSNSVQSNKIFGYLTEPGPKDVVNNLLKELLDNVCSQSLCIVSEIMDNILTDVCRSRKTKIKHCGERLTLDTKRDWEKRFPWLVILEDSDLNTRLQCNVCRSMKNECKLTSVWAEDGALSIQISSIIRHNGSSEHKSACAKEEQNKYLNTVNECDQVKINISKEDEILFNTVYFCAKAELPSSQINGMLELQRLNGLDIKYQNLSWDTLHEIQSTISSVLTTSVISDIESSPFYSLMLDESTDITVNKHLSICVRYIKCGSPVTRFLCNVALTNGKAHTIVNCMVEILQELGLNLSNCTSIATDGAAVMMGRHTGVGVQMEAKFSPFSVQVHCIAHRLNLACVDSMKKNEFMSKFRQKFDSLYHFFSSSSERTATLRTLQNVLEEPELSVKEPHSVRWLGLRNAVRAVCESYGSILAALSKYSAEKNAVAKGLYKYFTNYKVVLTTAFMLDVHNELSLLSCEFQKQNLIFSSVQPLLDATQQKLCNMLEKDGENLISMKQTIRISENEAYHQDEKLSYRATMDSEFKTQRTMYIESLRKNIKGRFRKEDSTIFSDLSKVLEPIVVNSSTGTESEEALERLGSFYGHSKEVRVVHGNLVDGTEEEVTEIDPLLDPVQLEAEWPRLKGMIGGAYALLQTDMLCRRIILIHKAVLPNFAKLASIALTMQLSSVECERSFSMQNRLKNKFRASLATEKLEILLRIGMLGPEQQSSSDSDYINIIKSAVTQWLSKKKRRKGRLVCEYKPRAKRQKLDLC